MNNKSRKINKFGFISVLVIALVTSFVLTPTQLTYAETPIPHPPEANPSLDPLVQENVSEVTIEETLTIQSMAITSCGSTFQSGGDRLVNLQNNDGGWDWPLNDGNPNNASPLNTVGPIAMGLSHAYLHTNDAGHLGGLLDAGSLLLSKTNNFSPSDGYLAAQLDQVFGVTTYTNHTKTYFYDPLSAGTYNRNGAGTFYNTSTYVTLIRTARANQGIPNLAAWDIGMGLVGAASAGADTSAWIIGTKAEINELNGNAVYDVIGLSGAIYGLAFVGEDYDPTAGEHAAASNLGELADILASYQINGGGFTWNKNYLSSGDETIQETAYAILALNEVDREKYGAVIEGAANYMKGVQLPSGGWKNSGGGSENNEVTGEALWGISVALPGPISSNVGATPNPVAINSPLTIAAHIDNSSAGCSNVASAEYSIYDNGGLEVDDGAMSNSFNSSVVDVYANATAPGVAGIYDLCVFGTDAIGNSGDETCTMLVVYDPNGGFVTGGGWIDSPKGAYNQGLVDPTGRANFGFVSKYTKGADTPTGNTEFVFKSANLNFHSTSYDWLVVTGSNYAKFKGTGTINGENSPVGDLYKFQVWAGDGTGTGGADTFRIKIWYENNGSEVVVYDNGLDQAIGGGNIVVHNKK